MYEVIIKKGVIKGFSSSTYKATVQMEGSLSVWVSSIPVARNIASSQVQTGRRCAILFFSEENKNDAVVLAVYT